MSYPPKPKSAKNQYEQLLSQFAQFSENRPRNLMLYGNPGAIHLMQWSSEAHDYRFSEILYPKTEAGRAEGDHFAIGSADEFKRFMDALRWGNVKVEAELKALHLDANARFNWQVDAVEIVVYPNSKYEAHGIFLKDDYVEWWNAALTLL